MRWKIKTASNILFEPILIYAGEEKWTHPEIDSMLEWGVGYDGEKLNISDLAERNIYKVWLKKTKEHPDFKMVIIHCIVENEIYPSAKWIGELLSVLIHEDVWSPGGEQFILTPAGQKISSMMPLKIEVESWSPDAGIERWPEDDGRMSYAYCS